MGPKEVCTGWMPRPAGPHKTIYNRCCCWSGRGVFDLIFSELSVSDPAEPSDSTESEVLMIDATDFKPHPTAFSLNKGDLTPA